MKCAGGPPPDVADVADVVVFDPYDWKIHEDRPHVETWEDLVKVSVLAQFLQVDDLKEHLRTGKECESSGSSLRWHLPLVHQPKMMN